MSNPSYIPHLLGVSLDSNGVVTSIIVAKNMSTGDRQAVSTNAQKVAVFDAANFTNGYTTGDVIAFQNCGASIGGTTITINNDSGGFQEATITCTTAFIGVLII